MTSSRGGYGKDDGRWRSGGGGLKTPNFRWRHLWTLPYKVINRLFTTIYGLITGILSAKFSRARYSIDFSAIQPGLTLSEVSSQHQMWSNAVAFKVLKAAITVLNYGRVSAGSTLVLRTCLRRVSKLLAQLMILYF